MELEAASPHEPEDKKKRIKLTRNKYTIFTIFKPITKRRYAKPTQTLISFDTQVALKPNRSMTLCNIDSLPYLLVTWQVQCRMRSLPCHPSQTSGVQSN